VNQNHWIPIEDKEMTDKPQMTEEQARQMYRDGHKGVVKSIGAENDFISKLKDHDYIKKSNLEIAKEDFYKYGLNVISLDESYTKLKIYKNELEKEVERLKNK
jgi:hypothetical protein